MTGRYRGIVHSHIESTCPRHTRAPPTISASPPRQFEDTTTRKSHGHRRHPRLRGPRRGRKPRIRRTRPPTTNAVLGRRARSVRGAPMASAANGADDGSSTDAGEFLRETRKRPLAIAKSAKLIKMPPRGGERSKQSKTWPLLRQKQPATATQPTIQTSISASRSCKPTSQEPNTSSAVS